MTDDNSFQVPRGKGGIWVGKRYNIVHGVTYNTDAVKTGKVNPYLRLHFRQLFRRTDGMGWGPELGIGRNCYYVKVVKR